MILAYLTTKTEKVISSEVKAETNGKFVRVFQTTPEGKENVVVVNEQELEDLLKLLRERI
jgi:hypothetical protein